MSLVSIAAMASRHAVASGARRVGRATKFRVLLSADKKKSAPEKPRFLQPLPRIMIEYLLPFVGLPLMLQLRCTCKHWRMIFHWWPAKSLQWLSVAHQDDIARLRKEQSRGHRT